MGDVESMFHAFHLTPAHRNFLRFRWWTENNPSKELTTFRAKVHVFGNTSSPAVATMCLRIAATIIRETSSRLHHRPLSLRIPQFHTAPSTVVAIGTLETAISLLSRFKIRLHKLVSNSLEVTQAFPMSEQAISTNVSITNAPAHR